MKPLRAALLGPVFVAWGTCALLCEAAGRLFKRETREEKIARMFPDSFIHNTKQLPGFEEPTST